MQAKELPAKSAQISALKGGLPAATALLTAHQVAQQKEADSVGGPPDHRARLAADPAASSSPVARAF